MPVLALPFRYFLWHYTRAFRDIIGIWANAMWFVGNLFSVKTLVLTVFQPLKLMQEEKGNFLTDPAVFAQNLLVNVIMRIVGAVTRLGLLLIALCGWGIFTVLAMLGLIAWVLLPPVLLGIFVTGVSHLV
jgi:hypothetical protein